MITTIIARAAHDRGRNRMNTLNVENIEMGKGDLLMVFWHAQSRKWWATVSPKGNDTVTHCGEGNTPLDALAELLVDMGQSVTRPN